MAHTCRNLVGLLLLLALLCPSGAQPLSSRETTPPVRVTFRVFALQPIPNLYYRPRAEAALEPIVFFSSQLSAPFTYVGPPVLQVYSDGEGGPLAASIPLSPAPAAPRAVLLFRPAGSGAPLPYDVLVVPDERARVPAGSVGTINATHQPFDAVIGDERVVLPPGIGPTVAVNGRTGVALFRRSSPRERRVGGFELELEAESRAWIVLFPPYRPAELQPQVRLLYEPPPAPEP